MGDRTIQISDRTRRELEARKRSTESLDDVIRRVLRAVDPLAGFGAWSDTEIDAAVREVQAEVDADIETNPP